MTGKKDFEKKWGGRMSDFKLVMRQHIMET